MTESYAEKIEDVLAGAVGAVFARSAVIMACKYAGVDQDKIDQSHLPEIAEKLQGALSISFGNTVANAVAEKVKNLS